MEVRVTRESLRRCWALHAQFMLLKVVGFDNFVLVQRLLLFPAALKREREPIEGQPSATMKQPGPEFPHSIPFRGRATVTEAEEVFLAPPPSSASESLCSQEFQ